MSDIDAGIIEKVARAISAAGMAWLKEKDPLSKRTDFGWADVPDEVFARAAISAYDAAKAEDRIDPESDCDFRSRVLTVASAEDRNHVEIASGHMLDHLASRYGMERSARIAGLSSVINAVHGEALQELAKDLREERFSSVQRLVEVKTIFLKGEIDADGWFIESYKFDADIDDHMTCNGVAVWRRAIRA